MVRSSAQSFADFNASAWNYLDNYAADVPGWDLNHLYDIYSNYNPDGLAAKVALTDDDLYQAMVDFIDGVGNHVVRIQTGDWPEMDKVGLRAQYHGRIGDPHAALTALAVTATTSYLHTYPTGTVLDVHGDPVPPHGRPANSNWRIGINVKPDEIAQAVAELTPIMDAQQDIDHIKYSAPGFAGKPDSVIIYMRYDNGSYDTIRNAVWARAQHYDLQPSFSPMWNEVQPGFAEAAEPPEDGDSFGTYRCVVTYLAYWLIRDDPPDQLTLQNFRLWLTAALVSFGIPPEAPHRQDPLEVPPFGDEENEAFFEMLALWDGKAVDAYDHLTLQNR